jgi:hypothetical protein
MFEAKILQGSVLKKIIEAIRELVADANLDCNERGITMQVCYFFLLPVHFLMLFVIFIFLVFWLNLLLLSVFFFLRSCRQWTRRMFHYVLLF